MMGPLKSIASTQKQCLVCIDPNTLESLPLLEEDTLTPQVPTI